MFPVLCVDSINSVNSASVPVVITLQMEAEIKQLIIPLLHTILKPDCFDGGLRMCYLLTQTPGPHAR